MPFFDPPFFAHCKAFDNFFLPSDTFLTLPILLQAQKDDPVLSTVYKWLKQKQRPYSLTPVIKANSFLYTYYKQFQHLYVDPNSHLIQYYTPNSRIFEKNFINTQPSTNQTHSHGHSGEKLSSETLNQFYFIPHLPLWFSIFIHDCIECQTNKPFPINSQNISPPLPIYENATHFNYRISMDTKGPISLSSQNNSYIFVIIDAFSHFVVTNPAPHITSKYTIQTLLHHWITKFAHPPPRPIPCYRPRYRKYQSRHGSSMFSLSYYSLTSNSLLSLDKRFSRSLKPKSWNSSPNIFFYKIPLLTGHFKLKCTHIP